MARERQGDTTRTVGQRDRQTDKQTPKRRQRYKERDGGIVSGTDGQTDGRTDNRLKAKRQTRNVPCLKIKQLKSRATAARRSTRFSLPAESV